MAENKKTFKGVYNWTFLLVVIVGIILANIIGTYLNKRWDMTEDERYSLNEGTVRFLTDESVLNNRLSLKIYLGGNLPSEIKLFRNALEDKLKEFKQYAGNKIEYEFIDPNQGTEEERQELYNNLFNKGKGIIPMDLVYMKDGGEQRLLVWPGAEINYKGATVNIIQFLPGTPSGNAQSLKNISGVIQNAVNNLEYMLISTFKRSVVEKRPRIAFLQGHGELTFAQTQRARALLSPNYSITDITLNDSIEALNGVDGLIIARPRSRFTDKDLFLIDQFVMKGGRLMCFLDALNLNEDTLDTKGMTHTTRNQTGIEKMLFNYGLHIEDNYVIDTRCAPKVVPLAQVTLVPWFFHVLATPTTHPMTRNLEPVSLKYVSEVKFVGNSDNRLTPVLTSSTNSTRTGMAPLVSLGISMNYEDQPMVANPKDENNKICLAGLSEGMYESYFKNRIVDAYASNPDAHFKEKSVKEGKVLLIGNGRFIENKYDSMPRKMGDGFMYRPKQNNDLRQDEMLSAVLMQRGYPPLYYGNQEFIQNMADYMMGDNTVIDIRSRQIDIHEIDKEKVKGNATFYKIINILLPCLFILVLGFVLNYIRKRKYTRI